MSTMAGWGWLLSLACVVWGTEPVPMNLRFQQETSPGSGRYHRLQRKENWAPDQTVLIVCDVWDLHHCHRAVLRVKELAPRLEKVIQFARERGVTIIHAPSSCMEFYADHPARHRSIAAPKAKDHPKDIAQWCTKIPAEEQGVYPIDQSNGGEDDEAQEHQEWSDHLSHLGRNPKAPWKRQYDQLTIDPAQDYISDRGDEIWNILQSKGIRNVILTGVHTNMCVLGRPFGLRRMVLAGMNTALMSDMTDTMYDPRCSPFVSHFTGTDLIVDHIERFICPTMTSDQWLGGKPFRFEGDRRPTVAILMAEDEYKTEETLPAWSIPNLGPNYRLRWFFGSDQQRQVIPGIEDVAQADVLVVSARRRPLPASQLQVIRDFEASGRPMLGIRTASHAFSLRNGELPAGTSAWPEFDAQVWGGAYTGHHGNQFFPKVDRTGPGKNDPLVADWGDSDWSSKGSLYRVSPLAAGTRELLRGTIDGQPSEPVAWTFRRKNGGKSFYTSLGHRDDFADERFQKLLRNAIDWLME
jgi:type 1 glutamine amidotransferase/nicotinamidase-related amidase